MKKLAFLIAVALLGSVAFAIGGTGPLSNVDNAVIALCGGMRSLLPVAAMMAIVLAGVIYAAGQMMGAETRARANVWATAALTGALIAILMAVVAPAVLTTIYNNQDITANCAAI